MPLLLITSFVLSATKSPFIVIINLLDISNPE